MRDIEKLTFEIMRKNNPILISLLVISQVSCDSTRCIEYRDGELFYFSIEDPNQRIISQIASTSSPDWGATIIPTYSQRLVIKNFKNQNVHFIDTTNLIKSEWFAFHLDQSTWEDDVLISTEKEHFKQFFDDLIKEGKLKFIEDRITNFELTDTESLEKGSKLYRDFYCYSNLTHKKSQIKIYTFINRESIILRTLTSDNYLIDQVKLFEEVKNKDFSFVRTAQFTTPNEFYIKKVYRNCNDLEQLESTANYKINSSGEILKREETNFENITISKKK